SAGLPCGAASGGAGAARGARPGGAGLVFTRGLLDLRERGRSGETRLPAAPAASADGQCNNLSINQPHIGNHAQLPALLLGIGSLLIATFGQALQDPLSGPRRAVGRPAKRSPASRQPVRMAVI